jgi:Tfp pilus assembly protein FimT
MRKGDQTLLLDHRSTRPSRDATHRPGMTLFEILLVLVLLVIVSSLSVPLFEGSFATVRLRRGSDQLLAAWSDARVQAVQTGRTYEFLFQSESGLYRVQPWQVQQVSDAVTDLAAADSTQAVLLTYEAELPEEIMFAEGDAITLTAANERTVETLNQSGESVWSAPILLLPHGSTS